MSGCNPEDRLTTLAAQSRPGLGHASRIGALLAALRLRARIRPLVRTRAWALASWRGDDECAPGRPSSGLSSFAIMPSICHLPVPRFTVTTEVFWPDRGRRGVFVCEFAELTCCRALKAVERGVPEPTPIQAQAIPLVLQDVTVWGRPDRKQDAGFACRFCTPRRHAIPALLPHASGACADSYPTRSWRRMEESVRTYGKYLGLRSTVCRGIDISADRGPAPGVEFLVRLPAGCSTTSSRNGESAASRSFCARRSRPHARHGIHPTCVASLRSCPSSVRTCLFSASCPGHSHARRFVPARPCTRAGARRTPPPSPFSTSRIRPAKRSASCSHISCSRAICAGTGLHLDPNRRQSPRYQLNRDNIHTSAIHGDKSQPERLQALADFKSERFACWLRPMSPHAGSISKICPTS